MLPPSQQVTSQVVTFYAGVSATNSRGAVVRTWPGPGVDFSAEVKPFRARRGEFHDVPEGIQLVAFTLTADPGVKVDDHFVWQGRTLSAFGPALDAAGRGVAFQVYCQEIS